MDGVPLLPIRKKESAIILCTQEITTQVTCTCMYILSVDSDGGVSVGGGNVSRGDVCWTLAVSPMILGGEGEEWFGGGEGEGEKCVCLAKGETVR